MDALYIAEKEVFKQKNNSVTLAFYNQVQDVTIIDPDFRFERDHFLSELIITFVRGYNFQLRRYCFYFYIPRNNRWLCLNQTDIPADFPTDVGKYRIMDNCSERDFSDFLPGHHDGCCETHDEEWLIQDMIADRRAKRQIEVLLCCMKTMKISRMSDIVRIHVNSFLDDKDIDTFAVGSMLKPKQLL